jgi:hypothetical protein
MEPTTALSSNEALLQLEDRLGLVETALAGAARPRLAQSLVLAQQLEDISRKRAAEDWPRTDNRSLSGIKPSEALQADSPDRVEAASDALNPVIVV